MIKPLKLSLPARGGSSCRNSKNIYPGSNGCIAHAVVDSKQDMYILSCANVLMKNEEMIEFYIILF